MERWARANYQPMLPLGRDGHRITACKEHLLLSKKAAREGMVLLKNEAAALPLAKGSRLALFGKATFDYVKGGGGSGDVTVSYTRNLYDGLKMLGDEVSLFEELADYYRKDVETQYASGRVPGMTAEPQVPPELVRKARAFTDTAVISICRFSGEGWDRKSQGDSSHGRPAGAEGELSDLSQTLFAESDFYLTEAETAMVETIKDTFAKVIVVLNVGGVIDTEWFRHDSAIQSVLMAWQGGSEGGLAAAELLLGHASPCGKLADTFAKRLEDYPSTRYFHESESFVDYTEDIYVGYRYFETIPKAAECVNYPFGFGLSYTSFSLSRLSVGRRGSEIYVGVDVCNTGCMAGREVVQVYFSAPQGKLGKPARTLAAFGKTRLLKTGETQRLILHFAIIDMGSYDDLGKIAKSAYVLEQGDYHFYVGTNMRDTIESDYVFQPDKDIVLRQLSEKMAPTRLRRRMLADGSCEKLPTGKPFDTDANVLACQTLDAVDGLTPEVSYQPRRKIWDTKEGTRRLEEVACGTISMDTFLEQLSDRELAELLGGQPNTGVANTFGYGNLPAYGVPNIMTADGPAGLRIAPACGVCTTAWPCATMLACTWDEALIEQIGDAAGKEVKENNIGVWLAPAVNIHRSPLCGRNFEYYSEDPLLTGKLAAAMVRGIQSNHIAATVKHFALNNKETNRKNSDSRASERAIREIYLRAFEIIVKEAKPWSIMSSYNIINGKRASENRELLEDILRGEWGFDGMVTTDWWTAGEHYKETKAGNDVKMGCGFPERLLEAMKQGALSRADMEICARRVLELILKID